MVHDQLHVRGGHQVTWAIDGVPIPNTNIATNVGPQIRSQGHRLPGSEAPAATAPSMATAPTASSTSRPAPASSAIARRELVASYGNYNQTNDQISLGDHTERFA